MSPYLITALMFLSMLVLMGTGLPIVYCLGSVGTLAAVFLWGDGALDVVYFATLELMNNVVLTAVPLFIFMGFVLHESKIAKDLFDTVYLWSGRMRGALGIGTVLICALMAAMLGVSSATVLSMGVIAVPAMLARHYDKRLAVGIVQAGGALGFLIPPSLMMIMYSFLTGVSVGKLFAAGVIPGLLLAGLYILFIAVLAWLRPSVAPAMKTDELVPLSVKLKSLWSLALPLLLIFIILGCIFLGVTSPTEAAALGAAGALACAAIKGRLSMATLKAACSQTFAICGFAGFLIIAALIFSKVYTGLGATVMIRQLVLGLHPDPMVVMLIIQLSFFILGMFMDDIAILFMCMPIYIPIIVGLGMDPVWFGVLFVVNMQMAYITPPYGLNLFYMKAVAPKEVQLKDIYAGALPFIGLQAIMLILLILFPQLTLWLPQQIFH
ncbi:TRAP transporter large permease subunit [Desulfovibrio sp.]|uniref:TRAP transporter large permease n=1 Tax=Desulfovibrio sp. TaxID=885 RepID=UPI0023BFC54E|nr:TRAP transporter large permease subunit [Desulfovibrio sp.]MDE7241631.1 TRAP transporter large permease subunit [Desulfovibrio sp.]